MAKNTKQSSGRVWKNERDSVTSKNRSRSKSNKYSRTTDGSKRPKAGTASRYWRAGYTRRDGTKVKGYYVQKLSQTVEVCKVAPKMGTRTYLKILLIPAMRRIFYVSAMTCIPCCVPQAHYPKK